MQQLNKSVHSTVGRPIKIMQFGEGNFLRAFCDYIIQDLNDLGKINTNVVVVQPMPVGRVADLAAQDGLYTVYLQGIKGGEAVRKRKVIDVLSDFINPYTEYQRFLAYAESEDLELVISNTTEAGIALDPSDTDFTKCPSSFPGKVLAFLQHRYNHFKGDLSKSLVFAPCELIDYNGRELKRVLLELAAVAKASEGLIAFINACEFVSTLVDRIVPGYPAATIEDVRKECGYIDNSVVVGEIFHLWVIENGERIQKILPSTEGINMVYAKEIAPFKEQKVKILNGAHTALVPIAYLMGIDTVREAVEDPTIKSYLKELIYEEIIPTIALDEDVVEGFANSVLERFLNPYVRHELMSIALNSTTKFSTRLLPSIKGYIKTTNKLPLCLTFALAALIEFHRGKRGEEKIALNDSKENLEFWAGAFEGRTSDELAEYVCRSKIFGEDLSLLHKDFVPTLSNYIDMIERLAMRASVEVLVK